MEKKLIKSPYSAGFLPDINLEKLNILVYSEYRIHPNNIKKVRYKNILFKEARYMFIKICTFLKIKDNKIAEYIEITNSAIRSIKCNDGKIFDNIAYFNTRFNNLIKKIYE